MLSRNGEVRPEAILLVSARGLDARLFMICIHQSPLHGRVVRNLLIESNVPPPFHGTGAQYRDSRNQDQQPSRSTESTPYTLPGRHLHLEWERFPQVQGVRKLDIQPGSLIPLEIAVRPPYRGIGTLLKLTEMSRAASMRSISPWARVSTVFEGNSCIVPFRSTNS